MSATREEIEAWRGLWVFLPAQERSRLPENYYYEHELIGCRCVSGRGAALGEVTALQDGPGGGLLVVATAAGEVLVPFRSPIVVRVDLEARSRRAGSPARSVRRRCAVTS